MDEQDAFWVREMMYGTRDEFRYIECPKCHTLQILEIPHNLGDYYGKDYYSYQTAVQLNPDHIHKDDRYILDIGCGSGEFLIKLYNAGASNLVGCDPYLMDDIHYTENFHIYNKSIHQMEGVYDQIYLRDSFEHITDPHEVLDSLKHLLAPDGEIMMAIPVFPNFAFQEFGANWYQLDAPRHIHLFSQEAIRLLAQEHGFQVTGVRYDSDYGQIIRSLLYQKDIPFFDQTREIVEQYFGESDIAQMKEMCEDANRGQIGDHARFYLAHV